MPDALVDALGRPFEPPAAPPRRVVSLVPSETESVAALAGVDRLAGRTAWCEEPRGALDSVPVVGGTKDVDVEAVLDLRPDLVLANQEENARPAIERLIAAGAPVWVAFPRTVDAAVRHLADLARLLGLDPDAAEPVREAREVLREAQDAVGGVAPVPVFVPIWKGPWMTFDGRAYASDALELAGFRNVFSDRPRRYPLAADLGRRAALDPARVGDRDTRYPRITLAEVAARRPEAALLPDEPYRFADEDAAALRDAPELVDAPLSAPGRVRLVEGKPLFWCGVRLIEGVPALRALAGTLRAALCPPGG